MVRNTTAGQRKSTASSRKSTSRARKSKVGGRKSIAGKKQSGSATGSRTSPDKKGKVHDDLFHPPWPVWDDLTICEVRWDRMPGTERHSKSDRAGVKSRDGSGTSQDGRKSVGGRKSLGSKRKSAAGRKSSAGRKSLGSRQSAVGRKSLGSRKSAVGRKSLGGRKSMGGKKSMLRTSGKYERGVKLKRTKDRSKDDQEDVKSFNDPVGHGTLPPTMKLSMWKRPDWINDRPPTLEMEEDPLDLYTNNQHLFKYKIMRHLISSIMSLERAALLHSFPVERQGTSYADNAEGHWKPLSHVYALTKAGPGSSHQPQWNPYGLYYVRIFYMGQWRRVAVDEYFPYDSAGQLLYPQSANKRNIWMPLLTKALLKVASMSWTGWDDAFDFDPIRLLTGWLHIEINPRYMTEDTLWRIIQHNMIVRTNPQRPPCVPTDDNHCIHEYKDIFAEESGMAFLFFETSESSGKTEDSAVDSTYQHIAFITMADNDTVPDTLPEWKKYRWVDWAISKGFIRGRPGTQRRVIDLFMPLKKTRPATIEETIQLDTEDGKKQLKQVKIFKSDTFYFADVYKCFEKLHIYYRTPFFKYCRNIDNIPREIEAVSQKGLEGGATKTGFVAGTLKPKSEAEITRCNVTGDCFYIWSDTLFCKNFIFSLHVLNVNRSMPAGFLLVEGGKWSLETAGPVWFCLRTYSSRSQALNLGPGVQMMRVWYSLPHTYHFTIHSRSPFTLCVRDQITNLAALESSTLFFYGKEMAAAYSRMIRTEPGSVAHADQYAVFMTTMCPPFVMCSAIPNPIEPGSIRTRQELMPLFEKYAMEMVFEFVHKAEVNKIAQIVCNYQKWFLDKYFGERYLRENGYEDILEKVESFRKDKWNEYYLGRLNAVRHLDGIPPLAQLPEGFDAGNTGLKQKNDKRKSKAGGKRTSKWSPKSKIGGRKSTGGHKSVTSNNSKSSRKSVGPKHSTGGNKADRNSRRSSKKRSAGIHGGHKKGSGVSQDKVYNQFLLENPVNNANLLRKMTQNFSKLLKQYPFKYDDTVRLSYFDFASVTEMVEYPTKWILIGRIVVNVHSSAPVPVGFHLLTETKPISMVLYDMDTNDIVPLGLDANFTYYIARNVAGYCLLLHGYPTAESREKSAQWRVRAFGAHVPDIPHVCSLSPPWGWGELGGPTRRLIDDTKAPGEFKMKEEIEKRNLAPNGERWGYCSGNKGPNPTLVMTYISENYFPNPDGLICKFLITMKRGILPPAGLVTLCFNTSRPSVKLRMKLKGADGKLVKEVFGVGICLLPAAFLTIEDAACDDRITPFDDETVKNRQLAFYSGEMWIVENSWPLTQKEYNILDQVRRDSHPEDGKKCALRVSEGAPNWKLIMVVENEQRNDILLQFDNRYAERFKKMKEKLWDHLDPHRLERGERLREEFLIRLAIERGEYFGEGEEEWPVNEDLINASASKLGNNVANRSSSTKKGQKKLSKVDSKKISALAYSEVEVDMGTDFVEAPHYRSKAMDELFERFKNPTEDPNQTPRVVELQPYQTNAPARLGPFDVYLDYVDVQEVEENYSWEDTGRKAMEDDETHPETQRKPSFGLPLGYLDPRMEKAQDDIKAWGERKMDKMYKIREEVIIELLKEKEQDEAGN